MLRTRCIAREPIAQHQAQRPCLGLHPGHRAEAQHRLLSARAREPSTTDRHALGIRARQVSFSSLYYPPPYCKPASCSLTPTFGATFILTFPALPNQVAAEVYKTYNLKATRAFSLTGELCASTEDARSSHCSTQPLRGWNTDSRDKLCCSAVLCRPRKGRPEQEEVPPRRLAMQQCRPRAVQACALRQPLAEDEVLICHLPFLPGFACSLVSHHLPNGHNSSVLQTPNLQ